MNMVSFANFVISNNNTSDADDDLPLLTVLTGVNLEQKNPPANCVNKVAILSTINVKFEWIFGWYTKYKK
jgi:hypothetical protein